jgi:deoxyadenosine/deoxycytidine kinase
MPGKLRGQLEEARRRREVEQRELERQLQAHANGDVAGMNRQRIVVVGPCASGKSALVEILRNAGLNAHSAAQEHSHVPTMWMMSNPSHLIYLDAGLETIKKRRAVSWGQEFLEEERHRLAHARDHADLIINTDSMSLPQVAEKVLEFINTATDGS